MKLKILILSFALLLAGCGAKNNLPAPSNVQKNQTPIIEQAPSSSEPELSGDIVPPPPPPPPPVLEN
ncbi:MAG: hypothetical protein Q7T50_03870 [Candidatus Magasanikbacteria bacterium]|nr:hypothetical protein [Candidatus Magasanikbacteria bacterium]